jgi:mannose-1-phosphate guanylyltransferase
MHVQVSVLREPDGASSIVPWAIVLAGGEGLRLRALVRQLCGDERTKQFVKIVGSKSLLGHTPAQRIPAQPQDRGTAAGILFPAHWIHSQDPEAVVSIFPADHFSLEEGAFMRHIVNLAAFADCVGRSTGEDA